MSWTFLIILLALCVADPSRMHEAASCVSQLCTEEWCSAPWSRRLLRRSRLSETAGQCHGCGREPCVLLPTAASSGETHTQTHRHVQAHIHQHWCQNHVIMRIYFQLVPKMCKIREKYFYDSFFFYFTCYLWLLIINLWKYCNVIECIFK